MEIPYRNTKILTKIIPKGTLLFRLTKNPENDLRGVPTKDGKTCVTPNFQVFFYPNPFIGEIALKKWLSDFDENMYIYILEKDVKVLYLLNPSKYSRASKSMKRSFLKRCSDVPKGCLPRKQSDYDPCLSSTIIKKYPDITGILSVSLMDALRSKNKKTTRRTHKYFHYATDSTGISGIPELALHPLPTRSTKDVILDHIPETNYTLLKTMKRTEDGLRKFMANHATYDPETFFFKYHA